MHAGNKKPACIGFALEEFCYRVPYTPMERRPWTASFDAPGVDDEYGTQMGAQSTPTQGCVTHTQEMHR